MVIDRRGRNKTKMRSNVDLEESLASFLKSSNTYKDKIAALKFFASEDTPRISTLFQELLHRGKNQKQDFKNRF